MNDNAFDEKASTWDDDPSHVERAEAVAAAVRRTVPLDRSARMLEYGAGTGLVSQLLSDTVGPITMADTSTGMREVGEGGHLAIVDLDEEDGTFHADGFDGHHGFDHNALASALDHAGFVDISFQRCHQIVRNDRTYPLFLATASRNPADVVT